MNLNDLNSTFVTADHHFGHENIIKYCNRPFESLREMDNTLVKKWNKVVSPDDTVYHLGDLTLAHDAKRYLERLNGHIKILGIPWHHDKRWLKSAEDGFLNMDGRTAEILPPMAVLEIEEAGHENHPLAVTLCHYPLAIWDRKHYDAWCLHGHTHEPNNSGEFILNVGVDCTAFYPINLGQVMDEMREKGWR